MFEKGRKQMDEKMQKTAETTGAFGPRIIMSSRAMEIENVISIELISENCITVSHGKKYSSIVGRNFVIEEIMDQRMIVRGEIEKIEFFGGSLKDNH